MRKSTYPLLITILLLTAACRREVEKLVVQQVDKQYSWAEIRQNIYGNQRYIVGLGHNATTLFLQEPFFMGFLTPQLNGGTHYMEQAAAYFPTDIALRMPLGASFAVQPARDTLLNFFPSTPADVVTPPQHTYYSLRQLDPRATGIVPNNRSYHSFGAIDRNGYLLFGYATNLTDTFLRFGLAHVATQPSGLLAVQAQPLAVPTNTLTTSAYIRWIVAIDNYFLVNCGSAGLFKVVESGAVKQVFAASSSEVAYKFQGVVYIHEQGQVLRSQDDGETWVRSAGTPLYLTLSTGQAVGDSLVCVNHEFGANDLFTLRWRANGYTTRPLRNDGFSNASINDLAVLGDTVYLGTTSGLYKRPLSRFFESKQ